MTLNFTTECTTIIRFPTDGDFHHYHEAVQAKYDPRMVLVARRSVSSAGTVAAVSHAGGLGAELRGLAYGHFHGITVS